MAGRGDRWRPPPPPPPPRIPIDYVGRMRTAAADPSRATPPLLLLAPMEGLGDRRFRQAIAETAGGFDEACTEFMRIPNRADHPWPAVKGVVSVYNAHELGNVPIGAQLMSSNAELLGMATQLLVTRKGAPRVDLNCGCPANTVTGNGAGSSLLRTPERLHACVKAMAAAAAGSGVPVSVKMRSGFLDTSLFEENLLAAQEGGAAFVTIHPRTKTQTYDGSADWSLIARAMQLLSIPVVGNGDVVSADAARRLVAQTGCGAVMIGRGAVADPLIFHRIRASYEAPDVPWELDEPEVVQAFLRRYAATCLRPDAAATEASEGGDADEGEVQPGSSDRVRLAGQIGMSRAAFFGRMKKIMRYIFGGEPELWKACDELLRAQPGAMTEDELVETMCGQVARHWAGSGPSQRMLFNHMSKEARVVESTCNSTVAAGGSLWLSGLRDQEQAHGIV